MRRVFPVALFALAVVATWTLSVVRAADDDKPKYTIKQAMEAHKKGNILDKVKEGKATKEDKEKLVALYEAMAKNEPPKGTKESWKEKTDALVVAAKAVEKGEDGAVDKLKAASNCGACHGAHKKG